MALDLWRSGPEVPSSLQDPLRQHMQHHHLSNILQRRKCAAVNMPLLVFSQDHANSVQEGSEIPSSLWHLLRRHMHYNFSTVCQSNCVLEKLLVFRIVHEDVTWGRLPVEHVVCVEDAYIAQHGLKIGFISPHSKDRHALHIRSRLSDTENALLSACSISSQPAFSNASSSSSGVSFWRACSACPALWSRGIACPTAQKHQLQLNYPGRATPGIINGLRQQYKPSGSGQNFRSLPLRQSD